MENFYLKDWEKNLHNDVGSVVGIVYIVLVYLGGGFKYLLICTPKIGEDSYFD